MGANLWRQAAAVALCCAFGGVALAEPPADRCVAVRGQKAACSGIVIPTVEIKRALACAVELRDAQRLAQLQQGECQATQRQLEAELAAERTRGDKLDAELQQRTTPPPEVDLTPWYIGTAILGTGLVALAIAVGVLASP